MADQLRVNHLLSIPSGEIELRTSRSSGPGGQHANVTASRVEAVFDVEASATLHRRPAPVPARPDRPLITAIAQDARGQARNRELAMQRLAEKIAAGLRVQRTRAANPPDPRVPATPPRAEAPRRRTQARPPPPAVEDSSPRASRYPRDNKRARQRESVSFVGRAPLRAAGRLSLPR